MEFGLFSKLGTLLSWFGWFRFFNASVLRKEVRAFIPASVLWISGRNMSQEKP